MVSSSLNTCRSTVQTASKSKYSLTKYFSLNLVTNTFIFFFSFQNYLGVGRTVCIVFIIAIMFMIRIEVSAKD